MAGSRLRGEVATGQVRCGARPAGLAVLCPALSRRRGTMPNTCRVQLRRRGARGGGLGGMLLGLAQLGDRDGQGRQVRDQRDRD